ncbi:Rieske 2Fe-2S domain-containing protein [Flavobacteriaceae bacterium]|nr:Rieske 2Fe-2S domain-containing protein [Flavobacteriaceae bacterium]
MNNRRNFLKTACKPIVLAAFGIPLIEACSTDDTTEELNIGGSPSTSTPSEPLEIDISSGNFTSLKDVGGWLNYTAQNILLVRISESEIRVFDNKCPHQGNRDNWSYDGDEFTCGYHNNSYSNSCSGSLTCYDTNLEGNILTVSF